MFAVDDLDETLARLRKHGAQLVDEVVQYEDAYRLCYVRGPEGILIGLAAANRLTPNTRSGVIREHWPTRMSSRRSEVSAARSIESVARS